MANLIVVNRLSVSLDTRAGSELEDERQYSASRIVELDRRASAVNPRVSIFMAFKLIVAQATLGTKGKWQQVTNPRASTHVPIYSSAVRSLNAGSILKAAKPRA